MNWHVLPISVIIEGVSAKLKTCTECGDRFYARSDARYCSSRCKQRAYHRRRQHTQTGAGLRR